MTINQFIEQHAENLELQASQAIAEMADDAAFRAQLGLGVGAEGVMECDHGVEISPAAECIRCYLEWLSSGEGL